MSDQVSPLGELPTPMERPDFGRVGHPKSVSHQRLFSSGHRYRPLLWVLPAAIGALASTYGLLRADEIPYVAGLVILGLTLGFAAAAVIRRPLLGRITAGVIGLVLVGGGITWPALALNAQYDGDHVRWNVADPFNGTDGPARSVALTVGDTAVIEGEPGVYELVSLSDGHAVAKLPFRPEDTLAAAGPHLLRQSQTDGGTATLYDVTGRKLWAHPASRALAYASGVTVLETCTNGYRCVEAGIKDDGQQAWTADVQGWQAQGRRFATAVRLPLGDRDPTILPAIALWALGDANSDSSKVHFQFADPATGKVIRSATADAAGVAGTTMVTSNPDQGGVRTEFDLSWPGTSNATKVTVGDTTAIPTAVGHVLFLGNTADYPAIDLGSQPDPAFTGTGPRQMFLGPTAAVDADSRRSPLQIGEFGQAEATGAQVAGGALGNENWTYVADSQFTGVAVGAHTAVVNSDIARSNPFEDKPGLDPTTLRGDADTRITVLDLSTGAVTGQVRLHGGAAVAGVGRGTAVVIGDGRIRLVGVGLAG